MTQLELRSSLIKLSITDAQRQQAHEALQKANNELEIRVENRTIELKLALEQLQNEIVVRQHKEEMLREEQQRLSAIIATQYKIATVELDLNKMMNLIVEQAQKLTCASGAVLELVEGDEMVYHAAAGSIADYIGLRLKMVTSLSGQCVRSGEILRCDDTEIDPRVNSTLR